MVSASGTVATRHNLAAINASTGALLPWAPNPNGEVRALLASADRSRLYVGGTFTSIGSASRTNLAAVSVATGAATSFRIAAPNGGVRALRLSAGRLYVGGTFWKIGTASRGGGAALDPTTGALKAWNPATNWGIYALLPAPDGSGIFVGGPFSQVHGAARPYLAKVSASTGALTSWRYPLKCFDPNRPREVCEVFGMVSDGRTLYVAAGGPGGRVTAFDAATGAQKWLTQADGDFQAIALHGDTILAGGHFPEEVNGITRAGLVGLDKRTGRVLNEPSAMLTGNMGVWSLLVDGRLLRVGGDFNRVGSAKIGRYTTFAIKAQPIRVTVAAARAGYGNVLRVDMSPNRGTASYVFRVQRLTSAGAWATLPGVYRTQGSGETRSVTLPKGIYRAYVPAAGGFASAVSKAVTLTHPTVKALTSRNASKSKLKVNVNPNKGSGYWTFRVQKRTANGTWSTLSTTYRTKGKYETRTINLRKGTYRVVVAGKYGYHGASSKSVTLAR